MSTIDRYVCRYSYIRYVYNMKPRKKKKKSEMKRGRGGTMFVPPPPPFLSGRKRNENDRKGDEYRYSQNAPFYALIYQNYSKTDFSKLFGSFEN